MEFFTQQLPSGYNYPFISIRINPMTFIQVLNYMENVPPSPVEKFYFDYIMVKEDDLNVDNLLLCDLEFVIFFKKCLTISKDLKLTNVTKCYECGSPLRVNFKVSDIRFRKLSQIKIKEDLDQTLLDGFSVKINGSYHNVRMPFVSQFLEIFSKYRKYKKVSDMDTIKITALFEDSELYPQKYELMVSNATHLGITLNVTLSDLFYKTIENLHCECSECKRNFERLKLFKMEAIKAEDDLDAEARLIELQESKYGGTTVSVDNLIVNLFRDIIENNKLTDDEIKPRKILVDEQPRAIHPKISI